MRPVDYRKFRLKYLNTPEFSHVKLLLFWPIFGLLFAFVERVGVSDVYTPVHIALDDHIPFCEWCVIPYLFWFVFLIGMLVYTFFFEVPAFRKMMRFVICTYSVTMAIYILFPRLLAWFYTFDTNTNVCPSLHVIGAVASLYAGWKSRRFGTRPWRIVFVVITVLISLSTVFLKQHSALDVFAAHPLCALGWWVSELRISGKKFAQAR